MIAAYDKRGILFNTVLTSGLFKIPTGVTTATMPRTHYFLTNTTLIKKTFNVFIDVGITFIIVTFRTFAPP